MLNSNATPDLPTWPSGTARFDGGILEVTAGDGIRAAVDDIVEIGVEPACAGRLSLTLGHRAGLDKTRASYGVEPQHEAALRRLVKDVAVTKGEA
jgi:hypothetical protein